MNITNIQTTTNKTYLMRPLGLRVAIYLDRAFVITQMPTIGEGADFMQTANNDKYATTPNFLTFKVDVPVNVYVGYDTRNAALPSWLRAWAITGQTLVTSDAKLQLYRKPVLAGTITLGGNGQTGNSMYTVLVVPQEVVVEPEPEPEPEPPPDGSHQETITFHEPGVYELRLVVTDAEGQADPTPPVRIITVRSKTHPNGVIKSPPRSMTIDAGDAVRCEAVPQADVTYQWPVTKREEA